jgi:hypothetical protein
MYKIRNWYPNANDPFNHEEQPGMAGIQVLFCTSSWVHPRKQTILAGGFQNSFTARHLLLI